jgi:UDP-N-acetylglucosamine 2-epimerase (non-hydrolysing)
MKRIKIITIAGARPNFMKVAPFLKKIADFNMHNMINTLPIQSLLVHTGQHYDVNMSEIFFPELGIQDPDINLGVGSGSHAIQTAKILIGFENVCERERPDWVVVVGDVNSTLAFALVCSKIGIRIAHIEAGLRSFDRTMLEEINRIVTDALSNLLYTPSNDADNNLLHEGIPRDRIKLVGNIMIDSLLENLPKERHSDILSRYHLAWIIHKKSCFPS